LKLIKQTSQRVLIAVPTIKLQNEICERAKAIGIEIIKSPSLREYESMPDYIWSKIEFLYKSGKSVIPYLKKIIGEDDAECSAIAKKYLKELDDFNQFNGHALTTHKRLVNMDVSKYDFVIIDEDIIFNSIIPNKTDIDIRTLKKIRKKIAPGSAISKKINQVIKYAKIHELFKLEKIDYDIADDDDKPMGVDMPSFCLAKHFCFHKHSNSEDSTHGDCISFFNPVQLRNDTKYIMVSATVDEKICEYYFGKNNMKFQECKKARYTGTLNQYYDKSMSRACIDKDPAIIKRIEKYFDSEYIICFKKYNLSDLYFGNTAGCDHMKGKNISVIGTPHQQEWIYKLFAYSIELDFDENAKVQSGITVDNNGYRFRFTTYNDDVLRAIQFYMIESELEQAVGRARLLRYDCTVNLFSNFPLWQANLKESEYDEEIAQ
jgi:hypothetical protein